MKTTVAEYIASVLSDHKLKSFFTIPGSSCISMNNALNNKGITPILSCSEESAAHAAHGYAAVTELFGCAVVSRGPAATNTITGLVTASEGYPILVIIGDNAMLVRQSGRATQDLPLEMIFDGVCDHATITNIDEVEEIIATTLHTLLKLKKSCVLIVPSDIWDRPMLPVTGTRSTKIEEPTVDAITFDSVIQDMSKADKNLLLLGSGILNDRSLRSIAETIIKKYDIPFVVSTRGLGHPIPQKAGLIGILAEPDANRLLYESDHVIIVDEPLDTATTGALSDFQEGRQITNISISYEKQPNFVPGRNLTVRPEEFSVFFESLAKRIKFIGRNTFKKYSPQVTPEIVLENILDNLPNEYVVCLDSGQNFWWAAHALTRVNKHRTIYSYTQATMGFGLPALVGVSAANSHGSLLICGDGGFLMTSEELSTIYSSRLKAKIVILNNSTLGMIYQTQKIKKLPKLAVDIRIHDLKKIVEGYGWKYITVNKLDKAAISQFLCSDNNCVLNVQINPDESVFPRGSTSERLPTV